MDTREFIYLVSISVGTGLLIGLAPALRLSKLNVMAVLKDASRGSTGGRRNASLTNLLVVAEMALAVVLLAGAGVMIRSFLKIYTADIGVTTENVLYMRIGLPPARYPDAAAQIGFFDRLATRLESHAGIESVSFANLMPTWRTGRVAYEVPDGRVDAAPTDEQRRPTVALVVTAPGYFRTLRAAVSSGRDFEVFDDETAMPVVVVNERFAATTWPDEEAVGKRVQFFRAGAAEWRTVVGVVTNIAQNDTNRQTVDPVVYLPLRQAPCSWLRKRASTRTR
jgi:putative ABC transport system permease protein